MSGDRYARQAMPYPDGWFAVCFSHELRSGKVLTVTFMGKDLVLYRTCSGLPCAIEPYCPHLGAHLGHGGRVEQENLVCPYHGLAFSPNGECIKTSRCTRPPQARLAVKVVCEVNGVVLAWHHHLGIAAQWQVPPLDAHDFSGARHACLTVGGQVQDMLENAADVNHFLHTHGFTTTEISQATSGHRLDFLIATQWRGMTLRFCMSGHGLGCVMGTCEVPALRMTLNCLAFATQTHPLQWTLRSALSLHTPQLAKWLAPLRRCASALLAMVLSHQALRVVRQDIAIWNTRCYLAHPMLAPGEGKIAAYRQWASQFFPPEVK